MKTDAQILRGQIPCCKCGKAIAENAARMILYASPLIFSAACIPCAQNEAGLNHELVKLPVPRPGTILRP